MTTKSKTMFSVTRRDGRNVWKRIGLAFVNDDGSENLAFDELPSDQQTTIQGRESEPEDSDDSGA